MSNYYGGQPHLRNELYHSGKKGMRWGISNNPLYKAVGNMAKGVLRNGRYYYDNIANYVNNTARDIRSGQAQRNVSNWARNLPGYVTGSNRARAGETLRKVKSGMDNGRATVDTYRRAKQHYNNTSSLGRDLSRIGRNVKNYASNTIRDIRSGQAQKNVGNWLKDRGRDVNTTARKASKLFGEAWDGQAGKGNAKQNAKQYMEYAKRAQAKGDYKEMNKWITAARNAGEKHRSSFTGIAEELGNRAVSGLKSVGRAAGKHAKNAADWAKDRKDQAADFIDTITGNKRSRVQATVNADQERGKKRTDKAKEPERREAYRKAVTNTINDQIKGQSRTEYERKKRAKESRRRAAQTASDEWRRNNLKRPSGGGSRPRMSTR